MAEEGDGNAVEHVFDEFSHQGCYIFEPSIRASFTDDVVDDDEIDDRPRKKRKSNLKAPVKGRNGEAVSEHGDLWPRLCAGAEPVSLARLRQETYTELWKDHKKSIDRAINTVDQDALQRIRNFVRTNGSKEGRLTTAVFESGRHRDSMGQVLHRWQVTQDGDDTGELLAQLQPAEAPNIQTALKNLISVAIQSHASQYDHDRFLAKHKKLIPMNYDLQLLHMYTQKHSMDKVIIAIPDVESFHLGVFSELISQLAMWSDRIPFALILSLATTVELLETRFSKATMRLLDAQVFNLGGNTDPYYEIFCAVQHTSETRPFFGPATISVLYDMTQDQSTTIDTFIRALKYIHMSHFFANPLSPLIRDKWNTQCDQWEDPSCQKILAEAIRNTPSFQSHCTALLDSDLSSTADVRSLLTNDQYTLDYTLAHLTHTTDPTDPRSNLTSSISRLTGSHLAIHRFIALYTHPTLNLPPTSPFALHILLSSHLTTTTRPLTTTTIYSDLISALRLLTQPQLTDLLTSLPTPSPALTLNISSAINTLITTHSLTSLISLFAFIAPPTTRGSTTKAPLFNLPEAHTYNLRHPLQSTFTPRPRHAIERALSQPADYLSCSCCGTSTSTSTSTSDPDHHQPTHPSHPTAILYTLLADAGRDINVRDLWDAFSSTLVPSLRSSTGGNADLAGVENEHANGGGNSNGVEEGEGEGEDEDRDEDDKDEDDKKYETQALALFYRSLAELKMLGLIKSASTTTSSKTKGVDVISKTTWKGL